MVKEWNATHPKEKVTAQEIPAGKTSEEVIGAAITAGNAPCLVFNTAPAAVPQFQKQGGLVPLDDFKGADDYIEARSGATADQYTVAGREVLPDPVEVQPGDDLLQQGPVEEGRRRPEQPAADDVRRVPRHQPARSSTSGAAPAAIAPAPTSEFFQSWFDFYPLYAAETGGKQTVEDGKATFDDPAGKDVWNFWAQMYKEGYSPKEKYNGDSFADKKAAMAIVGPWADRGLQGQGQLGRRAGADLGRAWPPSQIHTFTDAKNIALYSACKNQGTAWDVLKFATSKDQDGKLLETTGQMPIRTDLPTTLRRLLHGAPGVQDSSPTRPSRTVEVPNVPNSVEIWQAIRDEYSSVGDLRQDLGRRRVDQGGRQGHRARRPVLTGAV